MRRFCIPCSLESGRLTPRTAPVLERRKAALTERSRERDRRTRQREARRWIVRTRDAAGREEEVNVRELVTRACQLPTIRRGRRTAAMPELVLKRREYRDGVSGRAGYGEVYLGIWGEPAPREDLEELVVHELAHLAARGNRKPHSEAYRRVLVDALQERWPFLVLGSVRTQTAYQIDEVARQQLRAAVRGDFGW